jgi:hypothetical protein
LLYFAWQSGHLDAAEEKSAFGPRLLLLVTGLVFGGAGALFFLVTVEDPQRYSFSGFILDPMLCLAGFLAIIVALFFPAKNVRGVLEHYFKNTRPP